MVLVFFFAMQYLFLKAFSGCFMNVVCVIRNFIFNRYGNGKVPFYWLIIVILAMMLLAIYSYSGLIGLLPCIACILYSWAVWQNNLKITRIIEIISCSLYIIYNIKVLAFAGLISTLIEMTSAIIAIYRYDIKKDINNK